MRFTLEKNSAVREAAEAKKGMNAFGEIGVFILVFLLVTVGEVILMVPAILVQLFTNADFLEASVSADAGTIAEITVEIQSSEMMTAASLFATIAMIGIVLLFCRFVQKRKLRTLGFVKTDAGKEYLKGLAFGFLMFSAAVLLCVLTGSLTLEGFSEDFVPGIFLLFVAGFLIQGMAEEVMLRGYFLVSFGRRHSIWAAAVVNSVLFAVLHLLNSGITFLAFVNLTLFGIFASVYFVKTGNIWGIGALHSIWNLVQGNFFGIQVSGIETSSSLFSSALTEGRELMNGGAFGLEGGLAVTIVLVVSTLLLFWRYPAEPKKQPA